MAISCHSGAIVETVPGDCHAPLGLAMTEEWGGLQISSVIARAFRPVAIRISITQVRFCNPAREGQCIMV